MLSCFCSLRVTADVSSQSVANIFSFSLRCRVYFVFWCISVCVCEETNIKIILIVSVLFQKEYLHVRWNTITNINTGCCGSDGTVVMCVCLDWTDWEGEQHRGFSQVKEYNTLNHVLPAVTLTLESDQTAASLTQSVVNGAPLAIRFLTSSSWPFRAASSRRFPRSTNDIWHTQTFRSLNISLHFIPHEHADSASVHRYMFTFTVNLTVSCRTTDGSEPAQRQTAEQSDTLLYDWAGRFCCSWNWRQEKHNQTSVTEAGRLSVTIKIIVKWHQRSETLNL